MRISDGSSDVCSSDLVEAQARVNQREANASAIDALDRANQEQVRHGRKVSATIGAQRAAMAANGIDPGFGSAEDLIDDTRMIGQEDSLAIARSEEHTSELQSLMRISYAVFCLKHNKINTP